MEVKVKKFLKLLKSGNSTEAIAMLQESPDLLAEKNEQGISLLMVAAYHRNEEVLDYFVKHKPNLNLFEAGAVGHLEMVKENLTAHPSQIDNYSPDGFTVLGLACYFGHKNVVEYLLNRGADVNLPSDNGMRVAPLHSSVANKNLGITALLLEHGADVNAKQALGVTPLHSAAHQGDPDMIKLLLDHEADTNAEMENGKKPVDFAKGATNTEVMALLLR